MKNLLSPKCKMILSFFTFLLALLLAWTAFGFAIPTQMLAIKKAEAEYCLPPGAWELYRPSLDYKSSNTGGWYFSRRGDDFYIVKPYRNNSALWNDTLGPYRMAPLSPYSLGFDLIIDATSGITQISATENLILVTTPAPHAARVELTLNDQTVDCTESAPGSGFWVGTVRVTNEHNLNAILARAYDADENLIDSTSP